MFCLLMAKPENMLFIWIEKTIKSEWCTDTQFTMYCTPVRIRIDCYILHSVFSFPKAIELQLQENWFTFYIFNYGQLTVQHEIINIRINVCLCNVSCIEYNPTVTAKCRYTKIYQIEPLLRFFLKILIGANGN